ncbi:hypothetical protein E9228_001571 [Curtobacterium flaccumfaciens]|uniref:Oligosaccharide repeat unit polymerase n=1 Tax=Curtobacterium salicis TaxID=1779862 RepID=A0ABX0T620_9MICO|nr:hypothetical protein [Curtobacterium sp. WW7]NII40935.1 hypothetical protein [Curtobacterium sp. WW7]
MTVQPPSLALRLVLRFPTTTIVLAPYVLLFLPLAIWNDNPDTDFVIRTGALAVAGAFMVEAAIALVALSERRAHRAPSAHARSRPARSWHGDRVAAVARTVAVVSMVANLGSVLLGGGTLRAQVDSAVPSGVLTVLSPFVSWAYVAVALLIAANALGGLSRWATIRWLVALIATQAVLAYMTNLTARATVFLVLLATLAIFTRLVPRTWILAGAAACAVIWPTVFEIRNALRRANGIAVSDSVSATDRLRFDEQITRAAQYGPGHDLGQPDAWSALRYGFIPRFLDPNRPTISSGNLINELLGGSSISSYTFQPVATAWFFWGSLAVVLLYALSASIIMATRPWDHLARRPAAIILFALMLGGPLSWFSTPPDVVVNMLQTFVSTIPVLLVLRLWARAEQPRPAPSVRVRGRALIGGHR